MAKGDDLEQRLIDFAVAIILLCDKLPNTLAGRHVAGQLLRSGTSPAPNYAEARGAESRRDFIHKLGICSKEMNETQVWLKIIRQSRMLPENEVNPVLKESIELSRILNASIRTSRQHRKST